MTHIAIAGIRYTLEEPGTNGIRGLKATDDRNGKLFSRVPLPPAALAHFGIGDNGVAVSAEVVSFDLDALKAEARAAAVADLHAEHDAETLALRNRLAELEGKTQSTPAPLAAVPDQQAHVVPITEAKPKPATQRRPAPKK